MVAPKDAVGEVVAILPDYNRMDFPLLRCGDFSGADYYEGNGEGEAVLFSAHYHCFSRLLLLFVVYPLPLRPLGLSPLFCLLPLLFTFGYPFSSLNAYYTHTHGIDSGSSQLSFKARQLTW